MDYIHKYLKAQRFGKVDARRGHWPRGPTENPTQFLRKTGSPRDPYVPLTNPPPPLVSAVQVSRRNIGRKRGSEYFLRSRSDKLDRAQGERKFDHLPI